ncbi:MAG: hypothetical protein N3A38_13150, partial [Planctomycetota bacterium]|nr:hypothetical protein [Planctomycetota bacterium]
MARGGEGRAARCRPEGEHARARSPGTVDCFDELVELFQHAHYLGIFVVLVLSGIGLPVPEEVTFVAAGYMVHAGYTKFVPTVIVGYFGIIAGDIIAYYLGLRYGSRLYGMWPFRYILTPERLARVRDYFCLLYTSPSP